MKMKYRSLSVLCLSIYVAACGSEAHKDTPTKSLDLKDPKLQTQINGRFFYGTSKCGVNHQNETIAVNNGDRLEIELPKITRTIDWDDCAYSFSWTLSDPTVSSGTMTYVTHSTRSLKDTVNCQDNAYYVAEAKKTRAFTYKMDGIFLEFTDTTDGNCDVWVKQK